MDTEKIARNFYLNGYNGKIYAYPRNPTEHEKRLPGWWGYPLDVLKMGIIRFSSDRVWE